MRLGDSVGKTDPGRVRRRNEDAFVLEPPLFAVADGMGGAQAGEVASRLAAAAFREYREADELAPEERVQAIIKEANRRIHDRARTDSEVSGMGTTVTAALLTDGRVVIGHVGDSRAYRIRDGRLEQLTEDHSLVADLMRSGRLTPEEAEGHPQRSVITRALGTDSDVDVDTLVIEAEEGDLFLLCSDGLSTMVSDADLLATVERAKSLDEAARDLVRAANSGGGEDNVTVVLFRVDPDEAIDETLVAPVPGAVAEESEEESDLEDTLTDLRPMAPAVTEEPEPAAKRSPERRRRPRWKGRVLWAALGLGFVSVIIGGALYGLSRAYFVGADENGNVTVYQGVPFDLSDGVGLYRERYVSRLQSAQLAPEERSSLFDHELLSYDEARARIAVYEAEAVP